MAELVSAHFSKVGSDLSSETAQKLKDCRNGHPSQVQSHFSVQHNRKGPAVTRLQQALKQIEQKDSKLTLPKFEVTGEYDAAFAKAVKAYKTARGILNHAKAIDDIIGIQTIDRMDQDLVKGETPDPPSPPSPTDNSKPKADLVIRLEGNRVVKEMQFGDQVLPLARLRQDYDLVQGHDSRVLFSPAKNRFLLLRGFFLHDTGDATTEKVRKAMLEFDTLLSRLGAQPHRIYLYGSSAGGRAALDNVPIVAARFGPLAMLGCIDGHFTANDTETVPEGEEDALGNIARPTNIPLFKKITQNVNALVPGNRHNYFQTEGNSGKKRLFGNKFFTSDSDGEIHGQIMNFDNHHINLEKRRPLNATDAHDIACARGMSDMADKIVTHIAIV